MVQEDHSLTRFALAAAALLLSGCPAPAPRPSSYPSYPPSAPQPQAPRPAAPSPPVQHAPSPPPTPPPVRENHLSAATRSLVTQARTLMSHGNFDAASATLDRALRIEPDNPLVWIEIGRLRLGQSDPHQAEVCGRKALALASGDPSAQRQAGLLLADALRAQHRNPEAHEIESQPFMRQ